jgi:putative heme-binding domain-containing protein
MVKTGPDGALYFADMYRLVIEHPEYFPDELKHRPDLRAGDDMGRIYRIFPEGSKLRPVPRLDQLSTSALVAAIDSSNGWQRDTVQRMLVQAHRTEATPDLEKLISRTDNPKARLQALCVLSGLQTLTSSVLQKCLQDPHWAVRREALILGEPRFGQAGELDSLLLALENDPDIRVRYQLAFSLGEWKGAAAGQVLGRLFVKDWQDESMQTALLSSAIPHLKQILNEVFGGIENRSLAPSLVERLVELAGQEVDELSLAELVEKMAVSHGSYATWQMAGVVGLIRALEHRDRTLEDFEAHASPRLQGILAKLRPLFEQARRLASDPTAPEPDRLVAVHLLARATLDQRPEDVSELGTLLEPQNPTAVQNTALAGLRRGNSAQIAEVLLRNWRTCGPNLRQEVLNVLFSRSSWTEAVLTSIENGKIQPAELGPLQRQKLLNNSDLSIRERSARLFSAINADREKIVESYKDVAQLRGDRSKGQQLFSRNCSICHRLRGEGQSIGPDLGTVVDKPIQELVVAILDPNQAVDPVYTAYTATTKDEREVSGILVSETPNSISLRMAGGAEEQILRSNLRQLTSSGRSLMPEGFETGFKQQDLADLIAYILNPQP